MRDPRFAELSPEVGVLDQDALAGAMSDDPDATLALLVRMGAATDERLRELALRAAARIVWDHARRGTPRRSGSGRLRLVSASAGGDLDVEASLDALLDARARRRAPNLDDLAARDWGRSDLAACVLIDASGSMTGARLAAAACAAAACALRAPDELAVLCFAGTVDVLRPLGAGAPAAEVVNSLLRLRGHGLTALDGALRAAHDQLAASRARRKLVVLLSDCRFTDDRDPVATAARLDELVVIAPADDCEQAADFVGRCGAGLVRLSGPSDVPRALAQILDR